MFYFMGKMAKGLRIIMTKSYSQEPAQQTFKFRYFSTNSMLLMTAGLSLLTMKGVGESEEDSV